MASFRLWENTRRDRSRPPPSTSHVDTREHRAELQSLAAPLVRHNLVRYTQVHPARPAGARRRPVRRLRTLQLATARWRQALPWHPGWTTRPPEAEAVQA